MDTIAILAVVVIITLIVVILITIIIVVILMFVVAIINARGVAIDTRLNRAMMHASHHARSASSRRDDNRPRLCAQESHS